MSVVNYTRGVRLLIKKGNGASPEIFTPLCTISAARGITFNAQTNDETIPNCSDPNKIAWLVRDKQSLSIDVTGAGINNKADNKVMSDWWQSDNASNCQLILDDPDPDSVITWEGKFHLTQFDVTGDRGSKVQSTLSLSSEGEVTAVFGENLETFNLDFSIASNSGYLGAI